MRFQLALSCLSIGLIVCYRVYIRIKAYPNDTTAQVILGDGKFIIIFKLMSLNVSYNLTKHSFI